MKTEKASKELRAKIIERFGKERAERMFRRTNTVIKSVNELRKQYNQ